MSRTALRTFPRRDRGDRGVALLLVLVVLLLVATLATEIALTARTHSKLAEHQMSDFLLRSAVDGRREICVAALKHDTPLEASIVMEDGLWSWKGSKGDTTWRDSWGQAAGGSESGDSSSDSEGGVFYRNHDVKFLAWCEDERGKLNLCGLTGDEDAIFTRTRATLVRLIDRYRDPWPELDLSESEAEEMTDALVEWLKDKEDTDANPLPPTNAKRKRLLAIEDVLRIPGGKWTKERLFDVLDPRVLAEREDERSGRRRRIEDSSDSAVEEDEGYARSNGVPGLWNYVTVWGEGIASGDPKININTARLPVLEALMDPGKEELAKAIIEFRRGQAEDTTGASNTASATEDTPRGRGLKSLDDLKGQGGFPDSVSDFPARLQAFFAPVSSVFSIRVIAWMEVESRERDPDAEETDLEPANDWPFYDYREVVSRTKDGIVSVAAERRAQRPIEWQ